LACGWDRRDKEFKRNFGMEIPENRQIAVTKKGWENDTHV